MAKKKQTKVEEPVVEETVAVVEQPVVKEQPKVEAPKVKAKSKNTWEIKDRIYYLKGNNKPLSSSIRASSLFWFDKDAGYERELKYCQNQRTCFVDEMKGDQRLEHIIFRNGVLTVPKEKTVLQKLLSLYHPHRNVLFTEFIPAKVAANAIENLELEID